MTNFIPEELATALMCLAATVHDSNKDQLTVNSSTLLQDMLVETGNDKDSLFVHVNSEGKPSVADMANNCAIDWNLTVETYKKDFFTQEAAVTTKEIIEDVLALPGLNKDMVSGVRKALLRAFPA